MLVPLVLLILITISFFLIRLAPGDPQDIINDPERVARRPKLQHAYALRGRIKCQICGSAMVGHTMIDNGKPYHYYHCRLAFDRQSGQACSGRNVRAERLEAIDDAQPCLVGVTIRHLVPRDVRDLEAIEALPLSIVQKKVCALLLQGLSQPDVAERLGVSRSTVTDHVRKIYDKLDVHSADELRIRCAGRGRETGDG